MPASFLFYDLETFGTDPRRTRIAQFAAIRTTLDLEEMEPPHEVFVRPAADLLPSPGAALITGITPQAAMQRGVCEAEAFARIHALMSEPQTCSLGYNSLRFDDEFIRHGLFRNFFDPYEREWRNGNSRWDLLDVMRLAHALRPEGITWPTREDGAPSFKLEHLAAANGVREGDAHEAVSDVRALIGMARLFRHAQPRLWDYALRLRDKKFAGALLDVAGVVPVLHVSQRFPATRLCAAPVAPVARHPHVDNRVIVFDLAEDPELLLTLDAETIAQRLYVSAEDRANGVARVPLKEVHLNRSPMLVAWDHLRPTDLERLRIDPAEVAARAARIRERAGEIAEKVRQVFAARADYPPGDVDGALYDGFLDDGDRRKFPDIRSTAPEALAARGFTFRDPRLPELLFRYQARNWPESLDAAGIARWREFRRARLGGAMPGSEFTFATYRAELAAMRTAHADDTRALALLDAHAQWADALEADLA